MEIIDRLDWRAIGTQLDAEGYALLPGLFDAAPERALATLDAWGPTLYRHLAVIANRWHETLRLDSRFRGSAARAARAPARLRRLGAGDYLALGANADGGAAFPLQVVGLLSKPGEEFSGGEFLMAEQRPRMQSRPIVVPLEHLDAAIISVGGRPFPGARGVYRVNLKHGIGRVHHGERIGIELIFRGLS